MRDPVVCIVGAGPAGLAVAQLLRRAEIPFVLLERAEVEGLRGRVKAGMIEHRTVELLARHGLADTILARGSRIGICEFRVDGESIVLDYAALCGGRGHHIYPQHELVGDWADELVEARADLRFGTGVTAVEQTADGVSVSATIVATGAPLTIDCEVVACCDGAASAFSTAFEAAAMSHPFRWLTLIASVPPSSKGTIYGLHPRGFAGQMHRSATMTRFMLEVPSTDRVEDWPDGRVWAELDDRLGVADRPALERGQFVERDILDHRVRVCQPMQHGRVFLAGDAAHLITPAGGKGMNMALHDAVELAGGLCERYGGAKDGHRLAAYSDTRLPSVWRQQEFSNLMLGIFNAGATNASPGAATFAYGLRRARLDQIVNDPGYSSWFARSYVGVDDPD